jgi:hypothetical protein
MSNAQRSASRAAVFPLPVAVARSVPPPALSVRASKSASPERAERISEIRLQVAVARTDETSEPYADVPCTD